MRPVILLDFDFDLLEDSGREEKNRKRGAGEKKKYSALEQKQILLSNDQCACQSMNRRSGIRGRKICTCAYQALLVGWHCWIVTSWPLPPHLQAPIALMLRGWCQKSCKSRPAAGILMTHAHSVLCIQAVQVLLMKNMLRIQGHYCSRHKGRPPDQRRLKVSAYARMAEAAVQSRWIHIAPGCTECGR